MEFAVEELAVTVQQPRGYRSLRTARFDMDVLPFSSVPTMLDGQLLPALPINNRVNNF
jgi:hypothetical protein